jgi:hypothetical protein
MEITSRTSDLSNPGISYHDAKSAKLIYQIRTVNIKSLFLIRSMRESSPATGVCFDQDTDLMNS